MWVCVCLCVCVCGRACAPLGVASACCMRACVCYISGYFGRFPKYVQKLLPRIVQLDDMLQKAMEHRDTVQLTYPFLLISSLKGFFENFKTI